MLVEFLSKNGFKRSAIAPSCTGETLHDLKHIFRLLIRIFGMTFAHNITEKQIFKSGAQRTTGPKGFVVR